MTFDTVGHLTVLVAIFTLAVIYLGYGWDLEGRNEAFASLVFYLIGVGCLFGATVFIGYWAEGTI